MKTEALNFQIITDKIALNFINALLLNNVLFNGLMKLYDNDPSSFESDTFTPTVNALGIESNSKEYDQIYPALHPLLNSELIKDSEERQKIAERVLLKLKLAAIDLGVERTPVTHELIIELLRQAFLIESTSNIFVSIGMGDSYFNNLKPYILDDIFELCGIEDSQLLDDLAGQFNDISNECKTREDAHKLADLFYEIMINPNMDYCLHYVESAVCNKCKRRKKAA